MRNWPHIAAYLLLFVGVICSKKPKSFQIGSGWNLARMFFKWIYIDWHRQIFDLTSHIQEGGHDIISSRKVLPPGEWTQSICPHLCSIWSRVDALQFHNQATNSRCVVHSYFFALLHSSLDCLLFLLLCRPLTRSGCLCYESVFFRDMSSSFCTSCPSNYCVVVRCLLQIWPLVQNVSFLAWQKCWLSATLL